MQCDLIYALERSACLAERMEYEGQESKVGD